MRLHAVDQSDLPGGSTGIGALSRVTPQVDHVTSYEDVLINLTEVFRYVPPGRVCNVTVEAAGTIWIGVIGAVESEHATANRNSDAIANRVWLSAGLTPNTF